MTCPKCGAVTRVTNTVSHRNVLYQEARCRFNYRHLTETQYLDLTRQHGRLWVSRRRQCACGWEGTTLEVIVP